MTLKTNAVKNKQGEAICNETGLTKTLLGNAYEKLVDCFELARKEEEKSRPKLVTRTVKTK